MKFTDEDGKVWEWRGEYREPILGEDVLGNGGTVYKVREYTFFQGQAQIYAIIHPVPAIHEFGGVKFEETGEERCPEAGEWFLQDNFPVYALYFNGNRTRLTILRPLQGEK